jgi:hypothetical protein
LPPWRLSEQRTSVEALDSAIQHKFVLRSHFCAAFMPSPAVVITFIACSLRSPRPKRVRCRFRQTERCQRSSYAKFTSEDRAMPQRLAEATAPTDYKIFLRCPDLWISCAEPRKTGSGEVSFLNFPNPTRQCL